MLSSSAAADSARKAEDPPPPPLIPLLPDDLAVNCLARVSRFSHPTLSVVSKTIRSLIESPLYYSIRSNVGLTEPFLYVSLRHPTAPTMRWYTLFRSTRPSAAEKKTGNFLIPIPSIPSPPFIGSVSVSIGHEIYVIGGSFSDVPSSHVWVLDCRFHTWRRAPNMHIGREFAAAGVIDGFIYVIGGCVVDNWSRSTNWAESFDIKTQKWEAVPSPGVEIREKWMHASAVMQGKLFAMADRSGVVYEPREGKWELPEKRLNLGWRGRACVIDDILYCYDYLGKIRGYDPKSRVWLELRTGKGRLPKFLCGATMANLDGKLVVLWEQAAGGGGKGRDIEILCAEIDVEKREAGQIWGRILWSDVVIRVPNNSSIVNCLSVIF